MVELRRHSRFSRSPERILTGLLSVLVLVLALGLANARPAHASANLVVNPGFEQLGSGNWPVCWEQSGWGSNTAAFSVSSQSNTGSHAMQITMTAAGTGDRKAMMTENSSCAPAVTPGHQYLLGLDYMTSTPDSVVTMFRHDTQNGWQYWTDLKTLPVSATYAQTSVETPAIPANTDMVTWGVSIYGVGTLVTDDYTMYDATAAVTGTGCSAGTACTAGVWQTLPFNSPVRSIHVVLLKNGKILMVAGSGNDPNAFAAGTFTSAVYDPVAETFQVIPTPSDMFCSGHVQLANGDVLILGGNAAYPAADGSHGYEGLNSSYLFDPDTNTYVKVNNLNDGHWYPSATELGNGDVLAFGGLKADSTGSVTAEYFSAASNSWLPLNQVNQTWSYWGLYPAMILRQDGTLFYTGSHVFGNNISGTGSDLYNYTTNTITSVSGLQDKDNRDQSMSVLLPPAQNQEVLTVGGGNVSTNVDANRDTDLINLSAATPTYTAGPQLPQGTVTGGATETGTQGKMYVSLVVLPNGKVLETGGGLHDREDPVYEASMYDPIANTFTPVAADQVPRTYHSSAFLLPDGRVMAIGNNPGDGSFDMRVSVYSPPYLFDGARPQITSVGSTEWHYGSTQTVTVDRTVGTAELIRPAAVTHSSDPNQRYVALPVTANGNTLSLNVTSNPNLAPPGWYMLFVTDANGVPSVATWVHLT
ncbi:galactose oxidase-like domain-containing protein [Streptacidiphilus sp. N1-10]|uniref:Galactose oxidase-like domain-containing protein n=1 Tax=Streptacidiphilus jeojiensis TaxID=3229225 RepID=A0ABV6XY32_9ACTN